MVIEIQSPSFRSQLLASLIMATALIAGFVSLSQGLPGGFLLDDHARIVDAEVDSPALKDIMKAVVETDSGTFGRIIPLVSIYATKAISGEDSELFKLQNIALHLVTGLVVFWFLGKLLSIPRFRSYFPDHSTWIVAALASALWLLHPIQVSTALYVIQRMTQFATIFTLLALISYITTRKALASGVRFAVLPCFGFIFFSLAALFSKESAILIPLFILLIEYIGFQFVTESKRERIAIWIGIATFSLLPIFAGVVFFLSNIDTLLHDYIMRPFSMGERIASEAVIMWQYVGMLLMPRLSSMTLYHDGIAIYGLTSLWSIMAIFGWVIVIGIIIFYRKTHPVISFSLAFFIVSHLLESTILPLELMFEHRNYIGSATIMLALIAIFITSHKLISKYKLGLGIIYIAVACMFGLMQIARASSWSNPYAFALIAAKENPSSSRAVSMLANYQAQRGYLDEAQGLIDTAIDEQKHDIAIPGLMLHQIIFHCYEDDPPEELLIEAKKAIKNIQIDTYAISGLKVLRNRINAGECPALTHQELLPLALTAADNPNTRHAYRYFTNLLVGMIYTETNELENAKRYLLKAGNHSDYVSLVSQRNHAITLADICIELRDQKCSKSALDMANSIDRKVNVFIGQDKHIPILENLYEQSFGASYIGPMNNAEP